MADEEVMDTEEEWAGGMPEEGELKSQNERLAPYQVMNSTGGYVYKTDYKTQVMRFLCIGTSGGTYYTGEKELTRENAKCVDRLIMNGQGKEVVEIVREFSVENRACKQNPILYTLALCCRSNDLETKKAAYGVLSDVCRIPTHLFQFIKYCEVESAGTGWGRAHRRAISNWYTNYCKRKDGTRKEGGALFLALHMTKYRNRFGWSHKDMFRLSHIKPDTEFPELKYLVMLTTKGKKNTDTSQFVEEQKKQGNFESSELKKVMTFMDVVAKAEKCTNAEEMRLLILQNNLAREHVPTELLNSKEVWKALIKQMPMTAMIRNLGKMTSLELLEPGSFEEQLTIQKLRNADLLRKARVHPFTLLVALNQYQKGHGDLGKLKWNRNQSIVRALQDAFYLSFKHVEPTGKRFMLAVDVSGSMNVPVMGTPTISARDAAAAMMMVTARTEEKFKVVAFAGGLTPMNISANDDLDLVLDKCAALPFCGTDCSLPMIHAMERKEKYDVFMVYTDSETYFGNVHPSQALVNYRKMSGIKDARLIVCGMASNGFTIADPNDPFMMDIVGFDTHAPQAIQQFILGKM